MIKEIEKFDGNGNLIYKKHSGGYECWYKYDENNNKIYTKCSNDDEFWKKFDENNNIIHYKNSSGYEDWFKYNENKQILITEKEFKEIEYNIKIREYNSRTKCSRFELMDI